MASDPVTIEFLPNEILILVLSSLPTSSLLVLASVSHRFNAAVLRLLYHRLTAAASSEAHQLILECYHPSAKLSTPYLYCDYLGTTAGSSGCCAGGDGAMGRFVDGPAVEAERDEYLPSSLGDLKQLYSRFRPVVQEENRRSRLRHPSRVLTSLQQEQQQPEPEPEPATLNVHLDDCESFSQLCTVTNLVRMGPRRGLFLSHVNVSDGLIRVWRHWLAQAAAMDASMRSDGQDAMVLWADADRNVGVRFKVSEQADSHARVPVLVGHDEDLPVSYRLEYEELLVRTSRLLLMAEKADEQVDTTSDSPSIFLDPRGSVPQPVHTLLYSDTPLARQEDRHFDGLRWRAVSVVRVATA